MDEWITGFFKDRRAADHAVDELQKAGYGMNDISVMMTDDTRTRNFIAEKGNKAPEGATAGGVIGGALGAIVAGLTATGSIAAIAATGGLATPLVAGPLAAALAGLGAGAVGGGIIGGLVGLGIPEVHAKEYERKLRDGAIMVSVKASAGDAAQAREILSDAQADKKEIRAREKARDDVREARDERDDDDVDDDVRAPAEARRDLVGGPSRGTEPDPDLS